MLDSLFSSIDLLEQGLDASWLKNEVIANNIANSETENFKASSVNFEDEFEAALSDDGFTAKITNSKHMSFSSTTIDTDSFVTVNDDTTVNENGNNVDLDYENAELARNQIYYSTLSEQISSEFRRMSIAINGE